MAGNHCALFAFGEIGLGFKVKLHHALRLALLSIMHCSWLCYPPCTVVGFVIHDALWLALLSSIHSSWVCYPPCTVVGFVIHPYFEAPIQAPIHRQDRLNGLNFENVLAKTDTVISFWAKLALGQRAPLWKSKSVLYSEIEGESSCH